MAISSTSVSTFFILYVLLLTVSSKDINVPEQSPNKPIEVMLGIKAEVSPLDFPFQKIRY